MKINSVSSTPFQAGYIVQGKRTKKEVDSFFDKEIDRIKQTKKTTVETLNFLKTKEAQKLISNLPEGDIVYLSTVDDDDDIKTAYPTLFYQANEDYSKQMFRQEHKTTYKTSPTLKITGQKSVELTVTNWLKELNRLLGH